MSVAFLLLSPPFVVTVVRNVFRYWQMSSWGKCLNFSPQLRPTGLSSSRFTSLCYSPRPLEPAQVLEITFSRFTDKETKAWKRELRCIHGQYLMNIYCVPGSFPYATGILMGEPSLFLFYKWRTEDQILPQNSRLCCLAKTHVWETQLLIQYR